MTVVTPTDRPEWVRNRFVIEVFGGVFMLSIGFRFVCWYRGFRHRSESDLLIFPFTYILYMVKIVVESKQQLIYPYPNNEILVVSIK